jgi:A/G-specific adenine glycosylase
MEADGHVLLVTRPAKGLLGGMRALPTNAWAETAPGETAPIDSDWRVLDTPVRHVFTHFSLDLSIAMTTTRRSNAESGEWWPIADLDEAGLPTVFDKAAKRALEARMVSLC